MEALASPTDLRTSPLTDEQVVARVRAGEVALFEIIMRRHNERLFRVARAVLRDDTEAEDAVQEAYLAAYSHLDQFAGAARLSTWLTRIALNESFARRRRRLRLAGVEMSESDQAEDDRGGGNGSPEERASSREVAHLIEAAVDQLAEKYRVVFVMRAVQEMSTAETAACLDLTEEAVKVRLHRAREMLRDALAAEIEPRVPGAFAFLGRRCDRIVARVFARLPERPPRR